MSEKKKQEYTTGGLKNRQDVENALASAEYRPSQEVTDAASDLKQWQANRPGDYESAYQGRIDGLMEDLLDRKEFSYSYGADPLYRQYAQAGADVLVVPSAFTFTTGQAHWEVLLRARAIENQCFVLAAAQGGRHDNGRRTWGHSMAISPWGEVLQQRTDPSPGLVLAELQRAPLQQVRRQLPALEHRVL